MSAVTAARAFRHPRREAEELAGISRVLEPSPPAVDDGGFCADDPYTPPDADWAGWLDAHPEHAQWAADRWLAGHHRLPDLPPAYQPTRLALHRLAVYVVSPARRRANSKIGLRWTLGGFGTPFFGADEQVRVVGATLVRQRGGGAEVAALTSLRQAAAFALDDDPDVAWAATFDVPPVGDLDAPLAVDESSAAFLGAWYGFAYSVLEELRGASAAGAPDRVQLWPEHFDAAFGVRIGGGPVTFGASPGDAAGPTPYFYVLPAAGRITPSQEWNATSFAGAVLPLADLAGIAAGPDQRDAALAFFRSRAALLGG